VSAGTPAALLVPHRQHLKAGYYGIGFGTVARMSDDCLTKIRSVPVMQKKQPAAIKARY